MDKYTPIKLAHNVFEPPGGADESLTPVIFMHGVTGYKEIWLDIPQVIADGTKRKVYAVDARNHGDSEYTDLFNFEVNVDDLFHFMNSIQAPKAILVGHSMGGITAIKAALRKPERVEMMFAEDMFTKRVPDEILKPIIGFMELFITGVQAIAKEMNTKEAIKYVVDFVYSKIPPGTPYLTPKEKLVELPIQFNRTPDGGYDVKFNKHVIPLALKNHEQLASEPTGQYNGPAYFIYGSVSPFQVGKEEEHIKKHFPLAELIEFENATHKVHIEFPEKFAETLLQKLSQNHDRLIII